MNLLRKVLVVSIALFSIGLTPASLAVIDRQADGMQRVAEALDAGMDQVLSESESYIKAEQFSGGPSPGGGQVGVRTGGLRQDITHERTGPLSGTVGTTSRTSDYARAVLGPDATTIRPRNAKKLWVPIADNLNASGVSRFSPRALFDAFGRDRIQIFESKKGNTVVFVQDERNEDGSQSRFKRDSKKSGRSKGDLKGRLMFVLKDQVVIQGTDALAAGVRAMGDRASEILTAKVREALS
ncbi:MAG: hypothetical protein AAGL98_04100 [Planctomycetota bacterium]